MDKLTAAQRRHLAEMVRQNSQTPGGLQRCHAVQRDGGRASRLGAVVLSGKRLTSLAIPLLVGCGLPTQIQLNIDPSGFTPEQVEATFQASDSWAQKVGVNFTYTVGGCPGLTWNVVCVEAATSLPTDEGGLTYPPEAPDYRSRVQLLVGPAGAPPQGFQLVAEHELGHAMGLVHDPNAATVMYHVVSSATPSEPTPEDIAQWKALH
jgi:hypothetical protein